MGESIDIVISIKDIKISLLFMAIASLVLAFPFQVYANSPFPSLIPYIFMVLVILPSCKKYKLRDVLGGSTIYRKSVHIDIMILLYCVIFLTNSIVAISFSGVGLMEVMASVVNYVAPIVFYYYFRSYADDLEIKVFLLAAAIMGFFVGVYFAYDSIMKLAFNEIVEYSTLAFNYSIERSGIDIADSNTARVATGSRSFGLLQSHAVSGAWVIIGALATLAIAPRCQRLFRVFIIATFGFFLIIGLNFTSIIAFIAIIAAVEFGALRLLQLYISRKMLGEAVLAGSILLLIGGAVISVANDSMRDMMILVTKLQMDIIFGAKSAETTFQLLAVDGFNSLLSRAYEWPAVLLWGDGFTSFGILKGGDFGVSETVSHFGLPYFMLVIVGFIYLIIKGFLKAVTCIKLSEMRAKNNDCVNVMHFSVGFLLLILIMDLHYSVWTAKSILPILFIVLALFGRYLPPGLPYSNATSR